MRQRMTIGQVARLSGVPVRRIRFYADEGLLPPLERTDAGYRLFSEVDLVRLDLVRTLRDAGLPLESIRAVLRRGLTIREALEMRLRTVEQHIVSLEQVAAALRAALLSEEPDEEDMRRLRAVTRLSDEERRAVIERFFDQVSEGIPIDEAWKRRMIEASSPRLPERPSQEQLDAWVELSQIVNDAGFVEAMRAQASDVWGNDYDQQASRRAAEEAVEGARSAMTRDAQPGSPEAGDIVERFVDASANAMGRAPDHAFRLWLLDKYERHDPRASRYWELVGIMRGQPTMNQAVREWDWIAEAVKLHLRPARGT